MEKIYDGAVKIGLVVVLIAVVGGLAAKTWSDVFWARTAQTQMTRQTAILERIADALEHRN